MGKDRPFQLNAAFTECRGNLFRPISISSSVRPNTCSGVPSMRIVPWSKTIRRSQ